MSDSGRVMWECKHAKDKRDCIECDNERLKDRADELAAALEEIIPERCCVDTPKHLVEASKVLAKYREGK